MTAKLFDVPFAESGDRSTVPNADPGDGTISYTTGWGPDYQREIGPDPLAKAVSRQADNQLGYDLTTAVLIIQTNACAEWYDTIAYADGARVLFTDGLIYESLQAANTNQAPAGVTAWWAPVGKAALVRAKYIGCVEITTASANPVTYFGFGTWAAIAQGRAVVGVGLGTDVNAVTHTFPAGNDGVGEYAHTVTVGEMPAHDHPIPSGLIFNPASSFQGVAVAGQSPDGNNTGNTGGGGAHNNIQPSFGLYIWQRTA